MATRGMGATISFGTSAWTPELMSIGEIGETRTDIETTNLSTTGGRTYIPGILREGNTVTLECEYDDGDLPSITGNAETITITWADTSTTAFSGYVNDYKISGATTEDTKLTVTAIVKIAGTITNTVAS